MNNFSFSFKILIVIAINSFSLFVAVAQEQSIDSLPNYNTIENDTLSTDFFIGNLYKDYLSVGESINFNDKDYVLKWGVNPHPIYFKQEYYTQNDDIDDFKEKISIEIIRGTYRLNDALTVKINELEELKSINPIIDYEVFEDKNNNQLIIDFITNENIGFYEWVVHRYIRQIKPQEMLILFEYVYRYHYKKNDDVLDFLKKVKKMRPKIIQKVYHTEIDKIKIKD